MVVAFYATTYEIGASLDPVRTPGTNPWLAGFGFLTVMAGCGIATYMRVTNPAALVVALMAIFATDTGAIIVGKYLRLGGKIIRRRFSPVISPNKTWEGTIGGVLFGTALAVVVAAVLSVQLSAIRIAMIVLISVASVVGDLLQSAWKRSAGFKDSGKLLGAMGGVYDRLDSFNVGMIVGVLLIV